MFVYIFILLQYIVIHNKNNSIINTKDGINFVTLFSNLSDSKLYLKNMSIQTKLYFKSLVMFILRNLLSVIYVLFQLV